MLARLLTLGGAVRPRTLYEETFTLDVLDRASRPSLRLPVGVARGTLQLWFTAAGCRNAYYGEVLLRAIGPSPHGDGTVETFGNHLSRPRPLFGLLGPRHGYPRQRGPLSIPFHFKEGPVRALELTFRLGAAFAGTAWEGRFPCPRPEQLHVVIEPRLLAPFTMLQHIYSEAAEKPNRGAGV